jgi:hypothetical protein
VSGKCIEQPSQRVLPLAHLLADVLEVLEAAFAEDAESWLSPGEVSEGAN